MMMNWRFVEVLQSEDCISEYEEKIGYRFPEDFRECIKRNNGGYPEKKMFYSRKGNFHFFLQGTSFYEVLCRKKSIYLILNVYSLIPCWLKCP